MLVASVGSPSPVTQWGLHVLRSILEVALGQVEVIAKSRVDDLREAWGARAGEHFLLFIDNPDVEVAKLLTKGSARVVAFLEDPTEIVAYAMAERQLNWKEATKLTSLVLSTLHDIYVTPSTLLIVRRAGQSTGEVVDTIARHLNLSLDGGQFDAILRRICSTGLADSEEPLEVGLLKSIKLSRPIGQLTAKLPAEGRRPIGLVCLAYRPLLTQMSVDAMEWPRELFIGEKSPDPLAPVVELVGPARFLFHGPWLHLPAGQWAAQMRFEMEENWSGNTLQLDVFNGVTVSMGDVDLPAEGDYAATIDFKVDEPVKPMEFRALMKLGAIEGRFRARHFTMYRLPLVETRVEKMALLNG